MDPRQRHRDAGAALAGRPVGVGTIAVRRVRTAARRARSHPIALGVRFARALPDVRRADRSLSFACRGGLGADRRARARADARDGGLAMGAVRLVAAAAPIARRAALLVARPAQPPSGGLWAAFGRTPV